MSKHKSKEAKRRQKKAAIERNIERCIDHKRRHPCRCGESRPECLEFHHSDKSEKEFHNMHGARHGKSWTKIAAEIAKCEVKCSNCHRAADNAKLKNVA